VVSENVFSQYIYKTLPTHSHLWMFKKTFCKHMALSGEGVVVSQGGQMACICSFQLVDRDLHCFHHRNDHCLYISPPTPRPKTSRPALPHALPGWPPALQDHVCARQRQGVPDGYDAAVQRQVGLFALRGGGRCLFGKGRGGVGVASSQGCRFLKCTSKGCASLRLSVVSAREDATETNHLTDTHQPTPTNRHQPTDAT
jgi:hypothetical protein